jgi:ATP-dependent Lon protease
LGRHHAKKWLSFRSASTDGINKTFSGLMKVLYPHGEATDGEIEEVLRASMEGRKRVKDQLLRIDSTYPAVRFTYRTQNGEERAVRTLEEDEYPHAYHRKVINADEVIPGEPAQSALQMGMPPDVLRPVPTEPAKPTITPDKPSLKEQHLVFQENQKGVSFDKLFGPYLAGATLITITDPYLRLFHQQRNLMELLETITKVVLPGDEVALHLLTVEDEFNGDKQGENFQRMADACATVGIKFTWEYDRTGTKHDRDITTDHGWKIVLSRGLDVFQRCELNDAFSFTTRLQQQRPCKEFNVTFVRVDRN